MSSGGFLGMGEKLFAIPWSALTLDTDNKCFVLDVDKQRMQDAPAYRLNHEEVALALQEGISFTENMNPVEAIPDEFGHVKAMAFTRADPSVS